MLRLTISIILPVVLVFAESHGQAADPSQILKVYFERASNGQAATLTAIQLKEIPFQQVIAIAVPFLKDQKPLVRYKAIDLIKRSGSLSEAEVERKAAVALLTEACKDPDGGNSGVASSGLTLFNKQEFTPQVADSIASLLEKRCYHFERMIRIAGFLENPTTTSVLLNLKQNDSTLSAREAWAVELALARSGDSESLDFCIEKILREPVNDNTITYLFPDLVYIRHPESVGYLLQEIMSDEKKCRSSDPDREEEIICAFKIIEMVAPIIDDFPVKLTGFGEIDADDYDDTLLRVRTWIENSTSLQLNHNIY